MAGKFHPGLYKDKDKEHKKKEKKAKKAKDITKADADADGAAAEAGSGDASDDKNVKKKEKSATTTKPPLITHTLAAKMMQKRLQALVIDLRKQGKTEAEIKLAKIHLKRSIRHPGHEPGGSHNKWRQQVKPRPLTEEEKQDKAREEMGRKHDLIIVPIVWKQREEERLMVLDACADMKKILAARGVNTWIDQRTKYTPGQKYAYWEHLGVKVRLEMGPKEVESEKVTVSFCSVPGEVGQRWQNLSIANGAQEVLDVVSKECGLKLKDARDSDPTETLDWSGGYNSRARDTDNAGGKRSREADNAAALNRKHVKFDADSDDEAGGGGDSLESNYVVDTYQPEKVKRAHSSFSGKRTDMGR